MAKSKELLFDPVVNDNPIALQVLGICSALAVTSSMSVAFVMSLAVIAVTAFSGLFVSVIRSQIPSSIRIIVQMTIIASLVIVVDQILKAFAYEISNNISICWLDHYQLHRLGRAEAFAMKNGQSSRLLMGLETAGIQRYSDGRWLHPRVVWVRLIIRVEILTKITEGGWYYTNGMMLLPPSAFFIIGFIIWGIRAWKTSQVEVDEFKIAPNSKMKEA